MNRKLIIEIISFLFILLFVYTGVTKFLDFERFKLAMEQTALKPYAAWLRWIVPSLEILIAICITIPRLKLKGLYASAALMLVFTIYVAAVLKFSKQLPCSCGGVLEAMSWNMHLIFNAGFTLLALVGIWLERSQKKGSARLEFRPMH